KLPTARVDHRRAALYPVGAVCDRTDSLTPIVHPQRAIPSNQPASAGFAYQTPISIGGSLTTGAQPAGPLRRPPPCGHRPHLLSPSSSAILCVSAPLRQNPSTARAPRHTTPAAPPSPSPRSTSAAP